MKHAAIWVLVCLLLLLVALGHGAVRGAFWPETRTVAELPWGLAIIVDVYVGFFLLGGWIVFRERSTPRAALWIAALLVLGNLVSCVYVLAALATSRGHWSRFWLGRREAEVTAGPDPTGTT